MTQLRNLVNAVCFAQQQAPLVVLMTVVWCHVPGFSEDKLGLITTQLFDRLTRWLRRRRGTDLRAVWTRERGAHKGHHLHALLNVPVPLVPELSAYLCCSFDALPGAFDFSHGRFGMLTPQMQMGALLYIVKRFDHRAFKYVGFESVNLGDYLGIEHRGTDGVICAKRAGWTENIGPTARRRAGWRELRHLDEIAIALHPRGSTRIAADVSEHRRAV